MLVSRWVQVTEKAIRYFKGRCNAITCCNKPLVAIPVASMKKVERVNFDLPMGKKEKEKHAEIIDTQFEIYLKEGFLDLYLKPDYEIKLHQACSTHGNGT